jgi:transcriptional regulator with XRE-family HTH domain
MEITYSDGETEVRVGDLVEPNIPGVDLDTPWIVTRIDTEGDNTADGPVVDLTSTNVADVHDRRWQRVTYLTFVRRADVEDDIVDATVEGEPVDENGEWTHDGTLETVDATTLTGRPLRVFRESLGLSRRDVEQGTGYAGSVIWRAEQDGKVVTDEQRETIWRFLLAYRVEHPQGKVGTSKNPRPTNEQAISAVAERRKIALEAIRELASAEVDRAHKTKSKSAQWVTIMKIVQDAL